MAQDIEILRRNNNFDPSAGSFVTERLIMTFYLARLSCTHGNL